MDIISAATLAFFGSLAVGGLLGFLVGRSSAFELGLGVGLIIPGAVALTCAALCLEAYREVTAPGVTLVAGEVIDIEARPVNASGSITTPVPVVRFTTADGSEQTVRGASASGVKIGERVSVRYDGGDPSRARVVQPSQLRGGAIAFMLFGTFPSSVGLWFTHSFFHQRWKARRPARERAEARQALRTPLIVAFNVLLVGGIFWIGLGPGGLEKTFPVGFGIAALGMWGHGIRGLFDPRADGSWCFGMLVMAVNFSVWTLALWLLFSEWS